MSGYKGKRRNKKPPSGGYDSQVLGLILAAFGIITIFAFVLPIKAWILLLGGVLMLCGLLLLKG